MLLFAVFFSRENEFQPMKSSRDTRFWSRNADVQRHWRLTCIDHDRLSIEQSGSGSKWSRTHTSYTPQDTWTWNRSGSDGKHRGSRKKVSRDPRRITYAIKLIVITITPAWTDCDWGRAWTSCGAVLRPFRWVSIYFLILFSRRFVCSASGVCVCVCVDCFLCH